MTLQYIPILESTTGAMDRSVAAYDYFRILCDEEENSDQLFGNHCVTLLLHNQRPSKRFWIHDTIRRRHQLGEYHRLITELEADDERFKKYFHMSKDNFDEIFSIIDDDLTEQTSHYRKPIYSGERLAITLRSNY